MKIKKTFSMPQYDSKLGWINCNNPDNIFVGSGQGGLMIWQKCSDNCYTTKPDSENRNYKEFGIPPFVDIIIPKMTFTVIGWMGPAHEGYVYGNWWKKWGVNIQFIGTNPDPNQSKITFKLPDEPIYLFDNLYGYKEYSEFEEYFFIQPLLTEHQIESDLCICFQPNIALDFSDYIESIYFCPTEQASRIIPRNIEKMKFIYHYLGAEDMYKNAHPYEMKHCKKTDRLFLPHSYLFDGIKDISIPSDKPYNERTVFCGFMGHKGVKGSDSKNVDYICEHTYDERVDCLEAAERYITFKEHKGYHFFDKYLKFMSNCKFGINIGSFNDPNQRTFQIPACGGILIQKWYPELKELGFIDKVNCFTFKSIMELEELLYHLKYNSNTYNFEQIRLNGMKVAANHSSEQNALRFLKFIIEKELKN